MMHRATRGGFEDWYAPELDSSIRDVVAVPSDCCLLSRKHFAQLLINLNYDNFIFRRFLSWNSKQEGPNPLKMKGRICSVEGSPKSQQLENTSFQSPAWSLSQAEDDGPSPKMQQTCTQPGHQQIKLF